MAEQIRLPLPIPTLSVESADNSLLAAQTEYEETKIKILGDIRMSMESVLSRVINITDTMTKGLVIAQEQAKISKLAAAEDLEQRREDDLAPEKESQTLKEALSEGKGFWTLITAFFIPAIIGFVDTLFDLTTPFGLLKGAVTGLLIFFASRALLTLIAGSIKIMIAKLGAAIIATLASANIGQKISGMLGKSAVATGATQVGGQAASTTAATAARTGGATAARTGGVMKSITGSGLLKGAGAMLLAASAIYVLAAALDKFSDLEWETLAVAGVAITGLGVAVALLGKFSPIILTGSVALAAMGAALIPLTAALSLASPFLWAFGEALDAVSNVIDSVAGGIVSVLKTVSSLDPVQLLAAAGAITALSVSLIALGAGSLVSGLLNLFSGNPIEDLIRLGNVAPNIVALAEVMADFGNIVEFFNSALDNLDGEAAVRQFRIIRDGIMMVAEAMGEVSMVKLITFTALSKMTSGGSGVTESVSRNISLAAVNTGSSPAPASSDNDSGVTRIIESKFAQENPEAYAEYSDFKRTRTNEIFEEREQRNVNSNQTLTRMNRRAAGLQASKEAIAIYQEDMKAVGALEVTPSSQPVTGSPSGSSRSSLMSELTASNNSMSARRIEQPSVVSVNNVNSVNKNETNYKSPSLGSALQGDALRYVY